MIVIFFVIELLKSVATEMETYMASKNAYL